MTSDKSPCSVACMSYDPTDEPYYDQAVRENHSECVPSTHLHRRWFIDGYPCQRPDFHEEPPMTDPLTDPLDGHWSNGDPVHVITDGVTRHVAPNHNGATWVPGSGAVRESRLAASMITEDQPSAIFPEALPKLSWAEYVALREADPEVMALREAVRRGALSGPFTESTEGM